jgi:beta-phosphoglucomutase
MPISHAKRAFIFDMDGTITDNMRFHTEAWMRTLDELGLPREDAVTWEHRTSGVPNREILRERLNLSLDDVQTRYWVERKETLYREVAAGQIVAIQGFVPFLSAARAAGIGVAIATGAGPANIAFNLCALNLADAFDAIVGAEDVKRGKPDPEIFLTAAERVGASPEHAIVFEDAPMGLEAARRAGMAAIAMSGMLDAAALAPFPNVLRMIADYEDSWLAEQLR